MATEQDRGLTKLTAKVYAPMYAAFDRQLSNALLRRDAFLDRMISQEIQHLRNDLEGKRLSNEANRYISHSLKTLGGKDAPPLRQVSIAVKHETAEALRAAVDEHNLVRDAFLNRLIALVRSSDELLRVLELPNCVGGARRAARRKQEDLPDMPTSPLRAIEETLSDPFYYLRAACEARYSCGLYLLEFPVEYMGLYCYLDDDQVPGTLAYRDREKIDRQQLDDFKNFEANLTPSKNQGA